MCAGMEAGRPTSPIARAGTISPSKQRTWSGRSPSKSRWNWRPDDLAVPPSVGLAEDDSSPPTQRTGAKILLAAAASLQIMTDWHQPLRDDVRQLGDLLGQVLKVHDGPELFDRVERVRALSKRAHAGDDRAFDELADLMRALPEAVALRVARAFAHFLSLANIAEQHHRVRRRRDHAREPEGRPQRGSSLETLGRLRAAGFDAAALARAAASIRIELVLTAHPTEIVRRTLLQKHHRIARLLDVLDRSDLTPPARHDATEALQREIALAWQTDEVRHDPVSPLDEVRAGLVVFEESLWDAVPVYLRALDRALVATTGTPLPLGAAPIAFGSWIGGDRDGNRAVTPEVTRQAAWLARWVAADLYLREVQALRDDLSLTTATGELRDRAGG